MESAVEQSDQKGFIKPESLMPIINYCISAELDKFNVAKLEFDQYQPLLTYLQSIQQLQLPEKLKQLSADVDQCRNMVLKSTAKEKLQEDPVAHSDAAKTLERTLGVRLETVDQLEQDLVIRTQALEKLQQDLLSKTNSVNKLEQDLLAKTSSVNTLEQDLAVKVKSVDKLEQNLLAKAVSVDILEQHLIATKNSMDKLEQQILAKTNSVDKLEQELAAKADIAAKLEGVLLSSTELMNKLNSKTEDTDKLHAELKSRTADFDKRQDDLLLRNNSVEKLEARLVSLIKKVEQIKSNPISQSEGMGKQHNVLQAIPNPAEKPETFLRTKTESGETVDQEFRAMKQTLDKLQSDVETIRPRSESMEKFETVLNSKADLWEKMEKEFLVLKDNLGILTNLSTTNSNISSKINFKVNLIDAHLQMIDISDQLKRLKEELENHKNEVLATVAHNKSVIEAHVQEELKRQQNKPGTAASSFDGNQLPSILKSQKIMSEDLSQVRHELENFKKEQKTVSHLLNQQIEMERVRAKIVSDHTATLEGHYISCNRAHDDLKLVREEREEFKEHIHSCKQLQENIKELKAFQVKILMEQKNGMDKLYSLTIRCDKEFQGLVTFMSDFGKISREHKEIVDIQEELLEKQQSFVDGIKESKLAIEKLSVEQRLSKELQESKIKEFQESLFARIQENQNTISGVQSSSKFQCDHVKNIIEQLQLKFFDEQKHFINKMDQLEEWRKKVEEDQRKLSQGLFQRNSDGINLVSTVDSLKLQLDRNHSQFAEMQSRVTKLQSRLSRLSKNDRMGSQSNAPGSVVVYDGNGSCTYQGKDDILGLGPPAKVLRSIQYHATAAINEQSVEELGETILLDSSSDSEFYGSMNIFEDVDEEVATEISPNNKPEQVTSNREIACISETDGRLQYDRDENKIQTTFVLEDYQKPVQSDSLVVYPQSSEVCNDPEEDLVLVDDGDPYIFTDDDAQQGFGNSSNNNYSSQNKKSTGNKRIPQ